jgi:acyl-CoA thioesterase-1
MLSRFNLPGLLCLLLFCLTATANANIGTSTGTRHVLVYGDSLSAGFGIAVKDSWPALLAERLQSLPAKKQKIAVINASISGETTAGGRSRFDAAQRQFSPHWVILALGANDGLRGLPVAAMRDNLRFMIRAAKQRGARVLLVGMRLPPNYGDAYTRSFENAFSELAQKEKVALLPFLLEPVVADRNNFLPDGLHPTAAAQPVILDHVWSKFKPLLD